MPRLLIALLALTALIVGCADPTSDTAAVAPAAEPPVNATPFMPVANVLELMESVMAHAAEEYWGAVLVTVDEDGVHEDFPETDEEWEEVWAAGVAIAESGNLLMMAPRAVDDGAWMEFSRALVDAGAQAAAAAKSKSPDAVFEAGEIVYNACLACHMRYVPQ